MQIKFNIRQVEQVDSWLRPSLSQSTCGKSNWIVATINDTHLW